MAKKSFVNPYNFIPLHNETPERGPVEKGEYTGVISYTLMTKTPLFIPNTSNSDAFKVPVKDHKSYDFFSYNDLSDRKESVENEYFEPVIPGSEIRGMLRSYYEILTNSCLSALDDEEVLSKRSEEIFKAGLIEIKNEDTFVLHSAEDCIMHAKAENSLKLYDIDEAANLNIKSYKQEDLTEGQQVYVSVENRGSKMKPLVYNISTKDNGAEIGYVIKGEAGPVMNKAKSEKHNCHIFIEEKTKRELSKEEIKTMDLVLKAYKNNGENTYVEYTSEWEKFKTGEGNKLFPVYYSEAVEGYTMLSPASYTREIYRNKISKMVGDHNSCRESDKLCPACRLFGTIEGKAQIASRVRVGDARLLNKGNLSDVYNRPATLAPLNTPKKNNIEFYVKRPAPDAWFWTYDYYINKQGEVFPCTPEINGRKIYWHQPDFKPENCNATNLNITVRAVKNGVSFKGKVYFNHLNAMELNTLIFVLNAGEAQNIETKRHCYKLGNAKPLGYGSVAITVDNVETRKVKLDDNNETVKYAVQDYSPEEPEIDNEIIRQFKTITDFEFTRGMNVQYPQKDVSKSYEDSPIYEWFTHNHGKYNRNTNKEIGMAQKREQMFYREYMYALDPELRDNDVPVGKKHNDVADKRPVSENDFKKRKSDNHKNKFKKTNKPTNKSTIVRVNKVEADGSIFFVDGDIEGKIYSNHLNGKVFKVGDTVEVRLHKKLADNTGLYQLV